MGYQRRVHGDCNISTHHTMKVLIALSCLFAVSLAAPKPKPELVKAEFVRDITCSLCKTSIAKFDEWLTSDSTEGEVIELSNRAALPSAQLSLASRLPARLS